jgi:hypothetical protein
MKPKTKLVSNPAYINAPYELGIIYDYSPKPISLPMRFDHVPPKAALRNSDTLMEWAMANQIPSDV